MEFSMDKKIMKELIEYKLMVKFDVDIKGATDEQIYRVLSDMINELLVSKKQKYEAKVKADKSKRVYYLCMEFLMGRSLKNNLYNMGLYEDVEEILLDTGIKVKNVLNFEPDAGIGNGGLGRLGACFLDGLATTGYPSMGYSICYEYGIFRQKIIDGWQTELPDNWLDGGDVWLNENRTDTVEVRFGGTLTERIDGSRFSYMLDNYTAVRAVPYDLLISGYDCNSVSTLRLFKAENPGIDMQLFNSGNYMGAMEKSSMAEIISKILYPNDNHREGKRLRLMQQYFLTCASVTDIVKRHLSQYGTLDNLADKTAIHINDTHPALAIGELMRILLDECGFNWESAWETTKKTFAYTNHTVMKEALEVWNGDLMREVIPRVFGIICEINRRMEKELEDMGVDAQAISRMAIVENNNVHMANLSVYGSHSVNGVSSLHSQIIKDSIFKDFYNIFPKRFTNVTNGIAYRRWLQQGNPKLYDLLCEFCGGDVSADAAIIERAKKYLDDKDILAKVSDIKRGNKERFAKYLNKKSGIILDPESIFDVQVKRLHEYKRQHLNALHILSLYQYIKANPNVDIQPQTFIFGAKAAPGYYTAKQIIRLIYSLSKMIDSDPQVKDKIKIVFLEDYNVSISEILMPASDISEQISLAGTEASGTGNMKLMLNGAITLGTLDGANVEINQQVGNENMFLFGMTTPQVLELKAKGYKPYEYYQGNSVIKEAIDLLFSGIGDNLFGDIGENLIHTDPYMVLADFDSYAQAHRDALSAYADKEAFARMSFANTVGSGYFAADRSIHEYAKNIWHVNQVK